MATTTKSNDSSPMIPVTAVPTFDMESQQNQITYQPTHANSDDNKAQGLGIAMFVLLTAGSILGLVVPGLSFICTIATIAIASMLTCSCCGAENHNLGPNKTKYAKATLVSLCLAFVVQIVGMIAVFATVVSSVPSDAGDWNNQGSDQWSGQWSDQDEAASKAAFGAVGGVIAIVVLSFALKIAAIIFSALFTWGR